ncbi:MAG: hypothetical protein GY906_07090 [bacterium]|nr:hypothetical protein [bacterium]
MSTSENNRTVRIEGDTLKNGFILDGATNLSLSRAPLTTATTSTGDEIVAVTHYGFGYRKTNEDRIAVVDRWFGNESRTYLSVVDGMGGHQRGDISASIVAQELIRIAVAEAQELEDQLCSALVEEVSDAIDRLPSERLAEEVRRSVSIDSPDRSVSGEGFVRSAIEAVQLESVRMAEATSENLQKIAEVLRTLSGLRDPDPFEIAIRKSRERIKELGYKSQAPDACVVAATISAAVDGSKEIDLRQIGDCKLFVAGADGTIRFESFGESLIGTPNLDGNGVTLAELMTYSLHRNLVTNSVNSRRFSTKRYRRADLPLKLNSGDLVCIYSDGFDDLFSVREIVRLRQGKKLEEFVRTLLELSEERMSYVAALLQTEKDRLPPVKKMKAYPIVHRLMNEQRIAEGAYLEPGSDGSQRRWAKPPKCDNTAICALLVS